MSRIDAAFASMRQERRPGLVTYVTAGDPTLARSAEVLIALDRAGADVLEVGVPFSDPLADGPVIQRASERALAAGATLDGVLGMLADVRTSVRAPMVAFTYANPIHRMGFATFAARAAAAGVDGVLTLDIPMEESLDLRTALQRAGLDCIYLVSPTTTDARMRLAGQLGSGFVYAISRFGVTGARDTLASGIAELVARIRTATALPVAVGFGLSRPEHVTAVGRLADAAVVGSAIVSVVADEGDSPALAPRVEAYVRWLRGLDGGGGLRA